MLTGRAKRSYLPHRGRCAPVRLGVGARPGPGWRGTPGWTGAARVDTRRNQRGGPTHRSTWGVQEDYIQESLLQRRKKTSKILQRSQSQLTFGERRGTHRSGLTYRDRQQFTLTFTPTGNSKSPINLTLTLDSLLQTGDGKLSYLIYKKKAQHPQKTNTALQLIFSII